MTDAECRIETAEAVAATIDAAEEVFDQVTEQGSGKPRLFVDKSNPDETVAALRDILAQAGRLYDRGVPVRLAFDQVQKGHGCAGYDILWDGAGGTQVVVPGR